MKIDEVTQTLHRLAVENLVPYIEIASFEGDATDPASAFFDFIVEITKQLDRQFEDDELLTSLSDAFTMLDHSLTDKLETSFYRLDADVVDQDCQPKLVVELKYNSTMPGDDPLMHLVVDLPQIRTIIHKRARY